MDVKHKLGILDHIYPEAEGKAVGGGGESNEHFSEKTDNTAGFINLLKWLHFVIQKYVTFTFLMASFRHTNGSHTEWRKSKCFLKLRVLIH